MLVSRRLVLGGIASLFAAPAIVKASSLMKIKPLPVGDLFNGTLDQYRIMSIVEELGANPFGAMADPAVSANYILGCPSSFRIKAQRVVPQWHEGRMIGVQERIEFSTKDYIDILMGEPGDIVLVGTDRIMNGSPNNGLVNSKGKDVAVLIPARKASPMVYPEIDIVDNSVVHTEDKAGWTTRHELYGHGAYHSRHRDLSIRTLHTMVPTPDA